MISSQQAFDHHLQIAKTLPYPTSNDSARERTSMFVRTLT